MREVAVKLYQYSELSPEAQSRARDWWRDADIDPTWAISTIEDAARMGDLLGIEFRQRAVKLYGGGTRMEPMIYWQLGYMQSDGVTFEGTYAYRAGSVRLIEREAPQDTTLHGIARALDAVQRRNGYRLTADITTRGDSIDVEVDRCRTDADHRQLVDALRDFAAWVYSQLRAEYEWQSADEQVADTIEATVQRASAATANMSLGRS
jgi:hypothetical protein